MAGLLEITALIPFHPLEIGEWKVAQRVQSTADRDTATCRGSVWVLVIGIERSVVIEILLDMDETYIMLGEELTDSCRVGCFISRPIVAIECTWETSDVESQSIERPCCLGGREL